MEHSAYPFGRSIEHIENEKDKIWENDVPFPETVSTTISANNIPAKARIIRYMNILPKNS
jgi:hypothetical protein